MVIYFELCVCVRAFLFSPSSSLIHENEDWCIICERVYMPVYVLERGGWSERMCDS